MGYRPLPTVSVSLPRGFQLGPHPDPHDYHLYHGKRGHANEGDHHNRQKQFPGYQDYPGLDAEFGCTEWRDREGVILEAFGDETSNLFKEAFQSISPRKKSKLSVTFAR